MTQATGSGNALKVAGVIVLILAALGFASAQGWISPGGDSSEPGGTGPKSGFLVERHGANGCMHRNDAGDCDVNGVVP